jgi:hypothetical protein
MRNLRESEPFRVNFEVLRVKYAVLLKKIGKIRENFKNWLCYISLCYFIHRCANGNWHECLLNDTDDIYTLRLWWTLSAGKVPAASLATLKYGSCGFLFLQESPRVNNLLKIKTKVIHSYFWGEPKNKSAKYP